MDYKTQARAKLQELLPNVSCSLIDSTCPMCFGTTIISNSHKCQEMWNVVEQVDTNNDFEIAHIMAKRYKEWLDNRLDFISDLINKEINK